MTSTSTTKLLVSDMRRARERSVQKLDVRRDVGVRTAWYVATLHATWIQFHLKWRLRIDRSSQGLLVQISCVLRSVVIRNMGEHKCKKQRLAQRRTAML